jgi:hypothetical protein
LTRNPRSGTSRESRHRQERYLHFPSEVEAIKEMRDKTATADDDVPADVLKLLGEDSLRQMTTTNQQYI